jgi:hypothetical protein
MKNAGSWLPETQIEISKQKRSQLKKRSGGEEGQLTPAQVMTKKLWTSRFHSLAQARSMTLSVCNDRSLTCQIDLLSKRPMTLMLVIFEGKKARERIVAERQRSQ